jgi:ABC-type sugar transport system ATPase subunit
MNFLSVSNLHSNPQHGSFVLNDISFSQHKFQKIAVAGETGSGKSTLLRIIAGLIQPKSGEVFFDGKKVMGPDWQLIPGEKGIAYLSQHFELRHNYRMEELLAYANVFSDEYAAHLYKICRIDHLMKRRHDQLSGGESQRIALARLLVTSPRLLILDEPFSNLDLIHTNLLKKIIEEIAEELKMTLIMTSHEPADLLPWADEIIVMQQGKIIQKGSPQIIYKKPANEYCAALFGSYNLIENAAAKAIFKIPNDHPDTEKAFIRPESISVTPSPWVNEGAPIIAIQFMGNFYRLQIEFEEALIIADVRESNFKVGDKVSVSLNSPQ